MIILINFDTNNRSLSLISHGMSRNPGHAETGDLYEIEDIEG